MEQGGLDAPCILAPVHCFMAAADVGRLSCASRALRRALAVLPPRVVAFNERDDVACEAMLRATGGTARVLRVSTHIGAVWRSVCAVLPSAVGLRELVLRDGIIGGCHVDDAAAFAAAVVGMPHLWRLVLKMDEAPVNALLERVGELRRVTHLTVLMESLSSTILSTTATAALTAHLASPTSPLRKLKLSPRAVSAALLADGVARSSSLQRLTIDGGLYVTGRTLTASTVAALRRAVAACTSLRRLGVRSCHLEAQLAGAACPHLLTLKLDSTYHYGGRADHDFAALLGGMPGLRQLNFSHTTDAPGLVSALPLLPRLERLTLGGVSGLGAVGLGALVAAVPPTLQELYLHGCGLGDADLAGLVAALRAGGRLRTHLWGLGLNGNPVTDEGAACVAEAVTGHPALRSVGVSFSNITDVGARHLVTALATVAPLQLVFLYRQGHGCSLAVSEAFVAEARAALSHALVHTVVHRLLPPP